MRISSLPGTPRKQDGRGARPLLTTPVRSRSVAQAAQRRVPIVYHDSIMLRAEEDARRRRAELTALVEETGCAARQRQGACACAGAQTLAAHLRHVCDAKTMTALGTDAAAQEQQQHYQQQTAAVGTGQDG